MRPERLRDPWDSDAGASAPVEPYIDPSWQKLIPFADIAAWDGSTPPERQWLLEHWIPHNQATYLTGPGSAGKSLLAQQLCTCIALGLPFLGVPTRQANALYLSCEDDEDELWRREAAICRALDVPLSHVAETLRLCSLAGQIGNELATFVNSQTTDEFGRTSELVRPTRRFDALKGMAIANGVQFIALDNVAHLFAGNENIRAEVAAFISLLNQLAQQTGGAVLLIGHPNKAGDSFSGSTAWENQVRSRLFMETPSVDGTVADRDLRVLRREKSNYAENRAELTFRWLDWAFRLDDDLPESLREQLANTAQATHDNELFLKCLDERNRQRRYVSEKIGANYAPAVFCKMPESRGVGKQRLAEAMDRLFRLGSIEHAVLGRNTRAGRDDHGLRRVG